MDNSGIMVNDGIPSKNISEYRKKDSLTKQARAYIVYVMDGIKHIDLATYSEFYSLLGKIDSTIFGGRVYYSITNKDIENIHKTFDSVPGKLVFLENHLDFKINYNKKNSQQRIEKHNFNPNLKQYEIDEMLNIDNYELNKLLNEINLDVYENNKNNIQKM